MRFLFFILSCFIIAFYSCATPVAPSGGKEDKLAPRVAGIYPSPKSTNIPQELFVKVKFDEWINQTISKNAVTISPPLEKRLRFSVSGDELEITSKALLDSNTTYTLTIGNSLKDLRGNVISEPFLLTFSTGNSIDSLFLIGKALITKEMQTSKTFPSIALYPIGSERKSRNYLKKYRDSLLTVDADSIPRLTKEIPLFITEADSNGYFKLPGLHPGKYRALAFVDKNGNRRLDISDEEAGLVGDIFLDSLFKDSLWIMLGNQDTSLLELDSAFQIGKQMLEAKFNRNILMDSLKDCKLFSHKDTLKPKYIFNSEANKNPRFYFEKMPAIDSVYTFTCTVAKDSFGFVLDTVRNFFELSWQKKEADTLQPEIESVFPKKGSQNVFPKTPVRLYFNKPVDGDSLANELVFVSQKDTANVFVKRISQIAFQITPQKEWALDSKLHLLKSYLDTTLALPDSTGFRDTIVENKYQEITSFDIVSKLKIATLQGNIPNGNAQVKIRLRNTATNEIRDTLLLEDGSFYFQNLLEGNYIVDYFYTTKEGFMDIGSVIENRKAGAWRSPKDTLVLKAGTNILENTISLPELP